MSRGSPLFGPERGDEPRFKDETVTPYYNRVAENQAKIGLYPKII